MSDKFRVKICDSSFQPWPDYFDNFLKHCERYADEHECHSVEPVIQMMLKPMGGRLIKTSTQGWYLRWDDEASHTVFVLKWS